jgi:hypothetical protein
MVLYLLATNTINFIFAKQVMGIRVHQLNPFSQRRLRREEDWKEVSTKDRSIGRYIEGVGRVGL